MIKSPEQRIKVLSPKEYGAMARSLTRIGVINSYDEYRAGSLAEAAHLEREDLIQDVMADLFRQCSRMNGELLVMHKGSPHQEHGIVVGCASGRATAYRRR